jgi:hypothetical protein
MTTTGFPRLKVPRPPLNAKPPEGVRQGEKPLGYVRPPEPVMHACRPVDLKRPPRTVWPAAGDRIPERPGDHSEQKPVLPKPAFLMRGTPVETVSGDRQTAGSGIVSTAAAPPAVRVPAPPRQQAKLMPSDIPWNW